MSVKHALLATKGRDLAFLLLDGDLVVDYCGDEVHRLAVAQHQALALNGYPAARVGRKPQETSAFLLM